MLSSSQQLPQCSVAQHCIAHTAAHISHIAHTLSAIYLLYPLNYILILFFFYFYASSILGKFCFNVTAYSYCMCATKYEIELN